MAYLDTDTDARGVTTITLNRPDVYNAMDRQFLDEFANTLTGLDTQTRILVIAAAGKHFCAGADINWMKQSASLSDAENQQDAQALSRCLQALNDFPAPTIARVQGVALGGGTGLICCCDIVVADESAEFAFSEVRLGIIPATISPYSIAAIGARQARRYFLTGERIDAVDAYRLGLIHDVCSHDNLDHRVDEKIASLLACSPAAQRAAKGLITDVVYSPLDQDLRVRLCDALAEIRSSDEAQEGLAAFLEKRAPAWTHN